ncbi:hypothetical protein F5Y16DRAFT_22811 [Xylariaceae sp. FL0255]|nr:hypothetical protein F5Y16DRAFT_22811 [Xylariaceae sp. FL0255]
MAKGVTWGYAEVIETSPRMRKRSMSPIGKPFKGHPRGFPEQKTEDSERSMSSLEMDPHSLAGNPHKAYPHFSNLKAKQQRSVSSSTTSSTETVVRRQSSGEGYSSSSRTSDFSPSSEDPTMKGPKKVVNQTPAPKPKQTQPIRGNGRYPALRRTNLRLNARGLLQGPISRNRVRFLPVADSTPTPKPRTSLYSSVNNYEQTQRSATSNAHSRNTVKAQVSRNNVGINYVPSLSLVPFSTHSPEILTPHSPTPLPTLPLGNIVNNDEQTQRSVTLDAQTQGLRVTSVTTVSGLPSPEVPTLAGDIPEVPRIPDEFRISAKVNISAPQQQTKLQQPEVAKDQIKFNAASAPRALPSHPPVLPGCSQGKHKDVQDISYEMMQTYVAMRGYDMGGEGDPLFDWFRQRDELAADLSKPAINQNKDISKMLEGIDKTLGSKNADSPLDSEFQVHRPDVNHIKPPEDMDLSAHHHAENYTKHRSHHEIDSDDDSDSIPDDGRISPCTFLEWSKGCVRWDADKLKVPPESTASFERMRPTESSQGPKRTEHVRVPDMNRKVEFQIDIQSGDTITPAYDVPNSPSIIYTPPGVDLSNFEARPELRDKFRRMAPNVEREFRSAVYGGKVEKTTGSSKDADHFTSAEVNAAASFISELGLSRSEVQGYLTAQYDAVKRTEEIEAMLREQANMQEEHIKALQHDAKYLQKWKPALDLKRDEHDQKIHHERKVKDHIVEYTRELQYHLDNATDRVTQVRGQITENFERIAELEARVAGICGDVGVRDAQHAFDVLEDDDELDEQIESLHKHTQKLYAQSQRSSHSDTKASNGASQHDHRHSATQTSNGSTTTAPAAHKPASAQTAGTQAEQLPQSDGAHGLVSDTQVGLASSSDDEYCFSPPLPTPDNQQNIQYTLEIQNPTLPGLENEISVNGDVSVPQSPGDGHVQCDLKVHSSDGTRVDAHVQVPS